MVSNFDQTEKELIKDKVLGETALVKIQQQTLQVPNQQFKVTKKISNMFNSSIA